MRKRGGARRKACKPHRRADALGVEFCSRPDPTGQPAVSLPVARLWQCPAVGVGDSLSAW